MTYWLDKRVLATGGAGFIGHRLVAELVDLGADVTVVDDLSKGSMEGLKGLLEEVDFRKDNLLEPAASKRHDTTWNIGRANRRIMSNSTQSGLQNCYQFIGHEVTFDSTIGYGGLHQLECTSNIGRTWSDRTDANAIFRLTVI